jgi:hypothetical protein
LDTDSLSHKKTTFKKRTEKEKEKEVNSQRKESIISWAVRGKWRINK